MKFNPQVTALNRLLGRSRVRVLALLVLTVFSLPLFAATFTVNDLGDAPDAIANDGICATVGGVCTLRAAIQTANALSGTHVINVPAGTIVLASALSLGSNITINGASTSGTVISGNGVTQVFLVSAVNGIVAAMNDLTITGGNSTIGAGIFVGNVTLSLTRVLVINNAATIGSIKQGGGIHVGGTGTLNLTDSTVSNNSAGFVGGGVSSRPSTTVNIVGSTIVGNSVTLANGAGGGIANNGGTLNVINSTVSGNTAPLGDGGGITTIAEVGSSTNIRFSTITGNSAKNGGAQLDQIPQGALAPVVNVSGSIVANPASGPNCGGSLLPISGGNNLDSSNTCGFTAAGDLINSNPLLSPLANNGGLTLTHALLAASPAINAGPTAGTIPATDQRGVGFARVQSGRADIGAYESAFSPSVLSAPIITSAAPTAIGTVGTAYSFSVVATGSAPITFSVGTGSLPPGLTVNSVTGLISGTPTASGTFTGTIVAGNGTLPDASQAFSIVIGPTAVVLPTITIGNISLVEGNSGTSVMNFPITLSAPAPAGGVTITYSTVDSTATAGSGDYVAVINGTATIAAGSTSGFLPVTINGDTAIEANETFTVQMISSTHATLGLGTTNPINIGTGTILNDDANAVAPLVSVPVNSPWWLLVAMLGVLVVRRKLN